MKKISTCTSDIADHVAAELFDRLVELKSVEESQNCVSYKLCLALKSIISDYLFDDVIILNYSVPYLRFVKCESLYPQFSFA